VNLPEALGAALTLIGFAFFIAGTVGMLRFPDVYTRLHALTKADTLGLGFLCFGLALGADSAAAVVELIAIWALALIASAAGAQLIAAYALTQGGSQDGTQGGPRERDEAHDGARNGDPRHY